MSSKSKKRPPRSMSITRGIDWALAIFLYAFCDEFSSETDALDRLRRSVQSTRDSVIAGTLSLAEIRRALKDDFDLEV